MTISFTPSIALPVPQNTGLIASRTSNTALSVSAGYCWDSTYTFPITLSTAAVIDTSIVGAGGIDAGTLAANTTYYVYVIADAQGINPTDVMVSTSATTPYLPNGVSMGGYNIFRVVDIWLTNASSQFYAGYTVGNGNLRSFFYDARVEVLSAGAATTYTAVNLTGGTNAAVPAIDNTPVYLNYIYTPSAAGEAFGLRKTGSSSTTQFTATGAAASVAQTAQAKVLSGLSSSAARIDYIVTAADTLSLYVTGFDYYI